MNLIAILVATSIAGIGSVWIAAALLRVGVRDGGDGGHGPQYLLSLAAGALLATAFMHLLPEAFESGVEPSVLFAVLLGGLVLFFLLDKAELWHHGHEHHHSAEPGEHEAHGHTAHGHEAHAHDAHGHAAKGHGHAHSHAQAHGHAHTHVHAHAPAGAGAGGWTLLTGDSVHCFGDGVLIASAFMADLRLGIVASLAVLVHEVPHHMGDLVVLRQVSDNRRAALIKVSLAGAVTALGGIIGYALVDQLLDYLPFFLVMASSSFIYVALADLIPQLQKRLSARETAAQVAWLLAGMGIVTLISGVAHHH